MEKSLDCNKRLLIGFYFILYIINTMHTQNRPVAGTIVHLFHNSTIRCCCCCSYLCCHYLSNIKVSKVHFFSDLFFPLIQSIYRWHFEYFFFFFWTTKLTELYTTGYFHWIMATKLVNDNDDDYLFWGKEKRKLFFFVVVL